MKQINFFKKHILVFFLLFYMILVQLVNTSFFSFESIFDLLKGITVLSLLAIPIMIVMLTGGIDVSGTAIAISAGYISTKIAINNNIESIFMIFLIAMLIGAGMGLVNSFLVISLKLPTLIVTLATQSIFQASTIVFYGTRQVNLQDLPEKLRTLGQGFIFSIEKENSTYGLPNILIPFAIVVVVTHFILKYTRIGRSIYAVGNSEASSTKVGINVKLTKVFVYVYCGMLSAIMGIVYTGQIGAVNPTRLVGLELTAIAAVILGGVNLTGGKGSVFAAILGVMYFRVINKSLILFGLSVIWDKFFVGFVLLLGIGISSYLENERKKKLLIF